MTRSQPRLLLLSFLTPLFHTSLSILIYFLTHNPVSLFLLLLLKMIPPGSERHCCSLRRATHGFQSRAIDGEENRIEIHNTLVDLLNKLQTMKGTSFTGNNFPELDLHLFEPNQQLPALASARFFRP